MQNRNRTHLATLFAALALFFSIATSAIAQSAAPAPRITAAIDENRLVTLKGNTHPYATAANDRGEAPSGTPMRRMLLVLQRSAQQESALESLMEQQQDKSSANFHSWLTPQQFGQQFGPGDQDIQTVTAWLQGHGFEVTRVSNGRTVVEFSGTAGQVRNAFHASIHQYEVGGKQYWANASDPQIPAALGPVVAGVNTLYNFPRHAMHHVGGEVSRSKETGRLKPTSPSLITFTGLECGVPGLFCYGLGPYDFATVYNVLPLWSASPAKIDGTGVSIAIVGESDVTIQDVRNFRNVFGLPAADPQVILDGPDPGIVEGDETESDLDLEWSGAVAKGASIDFVVSETTEASLGVDLSAQYIVDNNLAPVLSESYGICELFLGATGNQFYNQLWQQAAAEGITALVATGDSGSAVCDRNAGTEGPAEFGLSVSGFSSTPYNVAVGGTDFNDLTNPTQFWSSTNTVPAGTPAGTPPTESALSYIPETTWNDSCTNAVFGNLLGFSPNAESNCNNPQLESAGFDSAEGGSGGKSGCTQSSGPNPANCTSGYSKPAWQTALTPADGARDVPDVSMFAAVGSPSGAFYLICAADLTESGATSCQASDPNTHYISIGGTSASTPVFAGIMALVNQKTGSRQGNANYVLYQLAAATGARCNSSSVSGSSCVFYDTTNGTIAMPCAISTANCVVSTPGDQVGVLSGYATAAGYDLATGLGSVNAANLVNAWGTASTALKADSTALSLNSGTAVNITHGQSVPFSINVTATAPATGTPTGNVSLIANTAPEGAPANITQQGLDGLMLANGSVSGSTGALPGGHYTVIAQYPGDGTFQSSASTPATVTVAPQTSATFANLVSLSASGAVTSYTNSTLTYGNGFDLIRVDVGDSTSTVSPATGISSKCASGQTNCPTGNVAFTLNSATSSLPLNVEGYSENQGQFLLTPGSYAGTASYPGDASYGASSANFSFTVTKATVTAQAAIPGSPIQYGDNVEIAAAAITTSDGTAPTGTFTFTLDGNPLSTTALNYEGFPYNPGGNPPFATLSATGLASFLGIGSHQLAAQYSGDANYAASNGTATTITVTQALPTFGSFGASPNQINLNSSTTLTASMAGSDTGVPPTGTMTFKDSGTAVSGTITYTPTAHGLLASLPYTPTTVGNHSITVSYSGDTNYLAASAPGSAPLTVVGPDYTIGAVGATTIGVSAGQSAVFTNVISVSPTDGFSGTVSLTCSLPAIATTCMVNPAMIASASGTATVTVTTTARSAAVPGSRPGTSGPIRPQWLAMVLLELAIFVAFTMRWRVRRRPFRLAIGLGIAVLALGMSVLAGCGGGGGQITPPPPQGTPAGTYTVTVSSTSGALTHTTTLTLIVD
jgi:Pro-kumamolisin, activation domain/Bacterial Ig-like domain (group 3)